MSRFQQDDEQRVSRRAGTLRAAAAACGAVAFAFVALTFVSAATAWMCIAIAVVASVGLIAFSTWLRRTTAMLRVIQTELHGSDRVEAAC